MNIQDLNSLIQIIETMDLVVKELEKAMEKADSAKINKAKREVLNFQRQIAELLKK